MRMGLVEIIRQTARFAAWVSGAPMAISRGLFWCADRIEGRA